MATNLFSISRYTDEYLQPSSSPVNLRTEGEICHSSVETQSPLLSWTFTGSGYENERSFRVLVASSGELLSADTGDLWDTGQVWQRTYNETSRLHQVLYEGKSLGANTTCYWKVMTWNGDGNNEPSLYSAPCCFTTSRSLPDAKTVVRQLVFGAKLSSIYSHTLESLNGRMQADGYAPTSLTGAYDGMFVRDAAGQAMVHTLLQDRERAQALLAYLLHKFERYGVKRAPHTVYPDNSPPRLLDEVDGNYYFIAAWAEYVLQFRDEEMQSRSYNKVRGFALYYLSEKYYNAELKLLYNPCHEHARQNYCMGVYDLLTNVMAVKALRLMQEVAERIGDSETKEIFRHFEQELKIGIHTNLTCRIDGKTLYAELRHAQVSESLVCGFSFFNLTPVLAMDALPDAGLLDRTVESYYQHASYTWGDYRVLHTWRTPWSWDTGWQTIGKGIAWEILYHADRGNWNRLLCLLSWLQEYNGTDLFAEHFSFEAFAEGRKFLPDPGNQLQASWFVYAMTKLREQLGNDDSYAFGAHREYGKDE